MLKKLAGLFLAMALTILSIPAGAATDPTGDTQAPDPNRASLLTGTIMGKLKYVTTDNDRVWGVDSKTSSDGETTIAYMVGAQSGLHVIDVSDLETNPAGIKLDSYNFSAKNNSTYGGDGSADASEESRRPVLVHGDYLYVALHKSGTSDSPAGIRKYDISGANISAPVYLYTFVPSQTNDQKPNELLFIGNYIYWVNDRYLRIFDDTQSPVDNKVYPVKTIERPNSGASTNDNQSRFCSAALDDSGRYLFVVTATNSNVGIANGIVVYDVANAANPVYVTHRQMDKRYWSPARVLYKGGYLFVTNGGEYDNSGLIGDIAIGEAFRRSLDVVDVRNPIEINNTYHKRYTANSDVYAFNDMALNGNFLYVGQNSGTQRIVVFDIADPRSVRRVGRLELKDANGTVPSISQINLMANGNIIAATRFGQNGAGDVNIFNFVHKGGHILPNNIYEWEANTPFTVSGVLDEGTIADGYDYMQLFIHYDNFGSGLDVSKPARQSFNITLPLSDSPNWSYTFPAGFPAGRVDFRLGVDNNGAGVILDVGAAYWVDFYEAEVALSEKAVKSDNISIGAFVNDSYIYGSAKIKNTTGETIYPLIAMAVYDGGVLVDIKALDYELPNLNEEVEITTQAYYIDDNASTISVKVFTWNSLNLNPYDDEVTEVPDSNQILRVSDGINPGDAFNIYGEGLKKAYI